MDTLAQQPGTTTGRRIGEAALQQGSCGQLYIGMQRRDLARRGRGSRFCAVRYRSQGRERQAEPAQCAGRGGVPPGFGANWDALADELCDLSWHEASGFVLLLRNASDTLGLSANDREIALDIFADTALEDEHRERLLRGLRDVLAYTRSILPTGPRLAVGAGTGAGVERDTRHEHEKVGQSFGTCHCGDARGN